MRKNKQKKRYRIIIFLLLSQILISCTKEKADIRFPDFKTPEITGYYIRNLVGNNIDIVGDPNIRLGNESNDFNSDYFFFFYPNPSNNFISISIKCPLPQTIKKLWITQATISDQILNSSININTVNSTVGGSPIFQTEFSNDVFMINLENFNEGFYRIYIKIEDYILYDNLVVNKHI
ncbi:MAG: hypothetical protein IMY72_09385 [Bacteroidetes bacterium]|nr:hypothetical protein [Bacteroidota bacterium]